MTYLSAVFLLLVMLTACADLPVNEGVKTTGTASLVWSSPEENATYLQFDPASKFMYAMKWENDVDSVVKIDLSTGLRVADSELAGLRSYVISQDQQFIATTREDVVSIIRRSDGHVVTNELFYGGDVGTTKLYLAWDRSGSSVYIWATGFSRSGLFRIPNSPGAGATQLVDAQSLDAFSELWRLRSLSGSTAMHVFREGVWDTEQSILRHSWESGATSSAWSSSDAKYWYSLNSDRMVKYDLSGEVISSLPIDHAEALYDLSLRDFIVSDNDRYAAFVLENYEPYPSQFEVWIVDLRDGSHVCHIDIGTATYYGVQLYFHPSNDRVIYINYQSHIEKWRF